MDKLQYTLPIDPYPTSRPRLGKNRNTYNTSKYTKYKNNLIILLKSLHIPQQDYSYVRINFYFPYPKSTPQKDRVDGAPMRYKYDVDNLIKGLFDALQQSGVVQDDRIISGVYAEKLFTTNEQGCIEFELE
jgi:Holliday junction resolvase RusA-like endonuclease